MCQVSAVWRVRATGRYGQFAARVLIKYAGSDPLEVSQPALCRSFAHTGQVLLTSRRSEAFRLCRHSGLRIPDPVRTRTQVRNATRLAKRQVAGPRLSPAPWERKIPDQAPAQAVGTAAPVPSPTSMTLAPRPKRRAGRETDDPTSPPEFERKPKPESLLQKDPSTPKN